MRILVVDDEPAVRESLEQVGRQRPDAVVLDVLMPRVDGLEACRRLRAAATTCRCCC